MCRYTKNFVRWNLEFQSVSIVGRKEYKWDYMGIITYIQYIGDLKERWLLWKCMHCKLPINSHIRLRNEKGNSTARMPIEQTKSNISNQKILLHLQKIYITKTVRKTHGSFLKGITSYSLRPSTSFLSFYSEHPNKTF